MHSRTLAVSRFISIMRAREREKRESERERGKQLMIKRATLPPAGSRRPSSPSIAVGVGDRKRAPRVPAVFRAALLSLPGPNDQRWRGATQGGVFEGASRAEETERRRSRCPLFNRAAAPPISTTLLSRCFVCCGSAFRGPPCARSSSPKRERPRCLSVTTDTLESGQIGAEELPATAR
jgi:hypothetical protein